MPLLHDNDLVSRVSPAIVEYQFERHPEGRGWPDATGARAVARSFSAAMLSGFASLRNELPMNGRERFRDIGYRAQQHARSIERVKAIRRRCRSESGAVGNGLFGAFSIADAMDAPVALRFFVYTPLSMALKRRTSGPCSPSRTLSRSDRGTSVRNRRRSGPSRTNHERENDTWHVEKYDPTSPPGTCSTLKVPRMTRSSMTR